MPCLFVRIFHGKNDFTITETITPGCEWVLAGEGVASQKWDGTACAVIDGKLYKRYDAKSGKTPPAGAIPCDPSPDPVTGHWPHWVAPGPHDKWHLEAWERQGPLADGTYELCGPKIGGNAERLTEHVLIRHGSGVLPPFTRNFNDLRVFLQDMVIEGIVFAHPDGRSCKIRRDDFGLTWPVPVPHGDC